MSAPRPGPADPTTGRSRRRLVPAWALVVAFVVIPLVEIYVVIQVGQVIGAWWTILLLIADSIVGSWLVRREGSRAWRALNVALQERRMPAAELADGALILAGGLLMVTPGFVLDVVGLLLVLPFTRPAARGLLTRAVTRRMAGGATTYAGQRAAGGRSRGRSGGTTHDDRPGPDVVRGDVVDPSGD